MKNRIHLFLFTSIVIPMLTSAQTDFKYDSTVYKTMYQKEFCEFLKANPQTVLIDVRSPGEYADTSRYGNLNIGHLKGAINISIDSVPAHMAELKSKADKPIVLYCSHSQRSRRVSKTLMENGFTQVWNLNGGMSLLNQANEADFPCKKDLIVSSLPYKTIPAEEAVKLIRSNKDLLIVDVRSASQYEGKDTLESLNVGRIKRAVNIPMNDLKNNLDKLDKNKTILVYDINGAASNEVAKYLSQNGYNNVINLLGGLAAIIGKEKETAGMRKEILEGTPSYAVLNTRESVNLIQKQSNLVILDIRPLEEYTNASKNKWRNLGHIKNAIHIVPAESGAKKNELMKYKTSAVLVYGTPDASAAYCKELKNAGFTNVNLMYGGIWDLVSASFNIKSMRGVRPLLTDHDGLY